MLGIRDCGEMKLTDSQSGFMAIRKDALDRLTLTSSGFEFSTEIKLEALRNHLRIKQIDVMYYPRIGKSKLRIVRDSLRIILFIIKQRIKYLWEDVKNEKTKT